MPPSAHDAVRVFVGNLPTDVRSRELRDMFHKYGEILDIDIKLSRNPSAGAFAFVEFESPRAAEDAVEGRDGIKFADRRLRVEFSGNRRHGGGGSGMRSSGPPRRTPYRVIVENLPSSASWQDVKDHMRTAGPVGFADANNGTGVVEYENEDDMHYAIRKLDGSEFRNKFGSSYIRVFAESGGGRRGRRSRSRSFSPRESNNNHSASHSPRRSSRRDRSRDRPPRRAEGLEPPMISRREDLRPDDRNRSDVREDRRLDRRFSNGGGEDASPHYKGRSGSRGRRPSPRRRSQSPLP